MVGDENEAQTTYESESEGFTHVKSFNSEFNLGINLRKELRK